MGCKRGADRRIGRVSAGDDTVEVEVDSKSHKRVKNSSLASESPHKLTSPSSEVTRGPPAEGAAGPAALGALYKGGVRKRGEPKTVTAFMTS